MKIKWYQKIRKMSAIVLVFQLMFGVFAPLMVIAAPVVMDPNISFVSTLRYVDSARSDGIAAQVKVPEVADSVAFILDSGTTLAGYLHLQAGYSPAGGYEHWRLSGTFPPGKHILRAIYTASGVEYSVSGQTVLYSIDKPVVSWVYPNTNMSHFRTSDNPLRLKIDDEFEQFSHVIYEISGTVYRVDRVNCDLRAAGSYVLCDVDRASNWGGLAEGNYRTYSSLYKPYPSVAQVQATIYTKANSRFNPTDFLETSEKTSSKLFYVDASKPIISDLTIDNVNPSFPHFSKKIEASALASDNMGIKNVVFYITAPRASDGVCDGNGAPLASATTVTPEVNGRYVATVDTAALNGRFCLNAIAEDLAITHSAIVRSAVVIDNTAPTATVSYLPATWTNGNVVATITPNEEVVITNNGGLSTRTFTSNGSFNFEFSDKAGNTGALEASVDWIDKVTPAASAFGVTEYSNNYLVNVYYSAGDPESGSGVSTVALYYRYNGGAWVKYGDFPESPISFNSDEAHGNGRYEFYTIATDKAGNVEKQISSRWFGYVAEESVYVDNIYPVVGPVSLIIDNKPYINGHDFSVYSQVRDAHSSGINTSSCEYTLNNGLSWKPASYLLGYCYKNGLTASDGQNLNINFRVSDKAGNTTEGTAIARLSDHSNPSGAAEIESNYYGPKTYTSQTIKGSASDTVSGVESVRLRIQRSSDDKYWDGNAWVSKDWSWLQWMWIYPSVLATGTTEWSYDLGAINLADGVTYTIIPQVITDRVGFNGSGTPDSFTWDSTAPAAPTLIYPTNNSFVNGNSLTNDWSSVADPDLSHYIYESYSNQSATSIRWTQTISALTSQKTANNVANTTFWWRVRSVDKLGNTSEWSELWKVTVNNDAPVIAAHAKVVAEATSSAGAIVTYDSPSASDAVDGELMTSCSPLSGTSFMLGTTEVHCSVTDSGGQTANSSFDVAVMDTTAPIITLNGSTLDITVGGTYTELGATASDIVDGDFAATPSGIVNTGAVGSYLITYNATDAAGNVAEAVTRTVNVVAAASLPTVQTPAILATPLILATAPVGAPEGAPEVLGAAEEEREVAGETDVNEQRENKEEKNAGLFKVAWYWWIVIVFGATGLWWLTARTRRKNII